jgi:hypothetical protein
MSTIAIPLQAESAVRRRTFKRTGAIALAGILCGALAGYSAASGSAGTVVALVAIFVPLAVWFRPQIAPSVIIASGLLVEQFQLGLTNGSTMVNVPITGSIPMFRGLGPIHLEPADLLPIIFFTIYMVRSSGTEARWWPRSQLALAITAVLGMVLVGELVGISHHGTIRESLFECRPFFYLSAAYLLTYVMLRTRNAVQAVLWAMVLSEGFKAVQGIYVYWITKNWDPKPQNVLGHEEALFFSIFFLLVAALWMFQVRGRLRTVATWLVPVVFFADLVNDRRAAWLILAFGLIVLLAVGISVLPHRRRILLRVAVVGALVSGLYLAAYWNNTGGTLGKPADAVRSQFGTPTARDALSDEYRIDEDANLKYNIEQAGVLGAGFGRQIDYALPMPGLVTAGDAGILYVPHNSVLYILMRLGLLGGIAFWSMLGAAIIAGCRLARAPDRTYAAIGAVVAAAIIGYALEGGTDMGFTFPRIAIVIGCLMGLTEAVRHVQQASLRAASETPS